MGSEGVYWLRFWSAPVSSLSEHPMDSKIAESVPRWEPGKTLMGLGVGMAIGWLVFFPSSASVRLVTASVLLVQVGSAVLITGRLNRRV